MKTLKETDFVLLNRANNKMVQFSTGGTIIYGNKSEATEDSNGNEIVRCTELPKYLQEKLIKEINS